MLTMAMDLYKQFLKNPIAILVASFAIILIIVLTYNLLRPAAQNSSPEQELSQQNITQRKEIVEKESLPTGEKRILYKSALPQRPNEVITNQDETIVLFERQVLAQNAETPSINTYKERFGVPEEIVQGSSFYGQSPITYIYASQGVAFIGSEDNKVLEVQKFQPTTVELYKQKFGGDIAEYHHPEE